MRKNTVTIVLTVVLLIVCAVAQANDYTCSGKCGDKSVGPISCTHTCGSHDCSLNCTCDPPKIACGSTMPGC